MPAIHFNCLRAVRSFLGSACLLVICQALLGDGRVFAAGAEPLAQNVTSSRAQAGAQEPAEQHPFQRRIPVPSLSGGVGWLNCAGPVDLKDLRGKFVLIDFWTYCCINCMHILPELKKLEQAYPNELVVIGVHTAKFTTERESDNIRQAILRYEIEHPVVNDAEQKIWQRFGIGRWPTLVLVDPEGQVVWVQDGESRFETLDALLKRGLPYYRQKGTLDTQPVRFDLEAHRAKQTPLRFPGKVLADEQGNRLFIADSNHNRIVVTSLDGALQTIIGTGAIGRQDGAFNEATFDHPQGMALLDEKLYVADTENHLLRLVDLEQRTVTTLAGTGKQALGEWPGMERMSPQVPPRFVGSPLQTALASPWALWIQGTDLYIAMAGTHQIWKMPLDGQEVGPFAGNGQEDIVDGALLPPVPYELGYASFAQPSGLASDGTWLYVADSEGSSIRAVPFNSKKKVRTVIGTAHLGRNRLFTFGDVDGRSRTARLQHPLEVAFLEHRLYLTDTYNHKIKVINLSTKTCTTLAGDGEPGAGDEPAQFFEPSGISAAAGKLFVADTNNHQIRVIDLADAARTSTLTITGLTPPESSEEREPIAEPVDEERIIPEFKVRLQPERMKVVDGHIKFVVKMSWPTGWKFNPHGPASYSIRAKGKKGPVDREKTETLFRLKKAAETFEVLVPVKGTTGKENVTISTQFYYCQEGPEGVCKSGTVGWVIPVELDEKRGVESVDLKYEAP